MFTIEKLPLWHGYYIIYQWFSPNKKMGKGLKHSRTLTVMNWKCNVVVKTLRQLLQIKQQISFMFYVGGKLGISKI